MDIYYALTLLTIFLIGSFFIFSASSKRARKFHAAVLPYFLLVLPILVGLIIGVFIGFIISFGSCYKSTCSGVEDAMLFILPLGSLLLSIPIAIKIKQRFKTIRTKIMKSSKAIWLNIGVTILTLVVLMLLNHFLIENTLMRR